MAERLAALDLGSNSFHLLVADALGDGGIERVLNRKLTLRLAEPVARDGQLGRQARRRALAAFAALVAAAREAGAERVAAVATSAVRDAGDAAELRAELAGVHPVGIRVLGGLEEGYLSLRAMAAALRLPAGSQLLGLDLGGGSYEVAYGGAGGLRAGATLPLGAARLRERLPDDPPRPAELAGLRAEARATLGAFARDLAGARRGEPGPPRAAATAGTIRDLGRAGLALATGTAPRHVRGVVVTREQFERAFTRLCAVPAGRRAELGASARRADLLPAGGAVLLATMDVLGLEQLTLCDWGLREGVLLDALGGGEVVGERDFAPL